MLLCQFCARQGCPCYICRGQGTCRNAYKLTFIWVEMVRPVIIQKLQNGLNVSFIRSDSRHVQVWMAEVTHSMSNHFSEVPQVHTTVLRSEVIPLHIIPIQAKAVSASCCLCISVDCFLDGLIHSGTAEGILVTKLDTETTLHELLVHLWVVNGRRNIVA